MEQVLGDLPRPRHQGGLQRRRSQPGRAAREALAALAEPARPRRRASRTSTATTSWPGSTRCAPPGERFAQPRHRRRRSPTLACTPLTANAYLGGWGIAAALDARRRRGGHRRVTDAALVVGPAAWRLRMGPRRLDALAGAVVAGHVIECGAQATGGNYAFFERGARPGSTRLPDRRGRGRRVVVDHQAPGHRRARLRRHGHRAAALRDRRPGLRQPRRDRALRHRRGRRQDGADRVRVSGVRGEPPPPTARWLLNYLGGFRNTMTLVLTGLDIEAKAELGRSATLWARTRSGDVRPRRRPAAPCADRPDPTTAADGAGASCGSR